jgi:branched-chain amino acid aminotransferase
VTRSVLLDLSRDPVEEGSYPLEQLLAADEAFLTSSIREVMPVRALDDKEFVPGPAAAALQTALRECAFN